MGAGDGRGLSQLRRGVLEFCVLSLLADERLYGFDLVRRLGAVDGMVISEGTVYPLLARLRTEGWVSTSWVESASGPPRRYYATTPAGRRALAAFAVEWRRFRDAVDQLMPGHPGPDPEPDPDPDPDADPRPRLLKKEKTS